MSMYGKKRVVLRADGIVTLSGSERPGSGGSCFRVGRHTAVLDGSGIVFTARVRSSLWGEHDTFSFSNEVNKPIVIRAKTKRELRQKVNEHYGWST